MIPLTPDEAREALGLGTIHVPVTRVNTDSRTVAPGDLFVALRGERFDGHDFVIRALQSGAAGAVVDSTWWNEGGSQALSSSPELRPLVHVVSDTLSALGRLANAVRRKSSAVVVGITGSVGKTGTKDLLRLMAAEAGNTIATTANHNNEIGVPLTLLSLEPGTSTAIVEMGMRGLGQIADLARVVEPDVGLITNVYPVHLELLGTLENVARAKSELLLGLRPGGTGVVPAGCPVLDSVLRDSPVLRFGLGDKAAGAEIRGEMERLPGGETAILRLTWPEGEAEVEVTFVSRARMENAVAAAAACYAAGLPMDVCLAGLRTAQFTPSRGDVQRVGDWLIINDTYNSSPAAVQESIDELTRVAAECGGRPVAVLGDMLELGEQTAKFHEEAGAYAAGKGVQVLWAVGPLSRSTMDGYKAAAPAGEAGWVEQSSDAAPVMETLRPGDVVLFKASRSMKLEVMLESLRRFAAEQPEEARASADRAASASSKSTSFESEAG